MNISHKEKEGTSVEFDAKEDEKKKMKEKGKHTEKYPNDKLELIEIEKNKLKEEPCFVITADDVYDVFSLPRNDGNEALKLGSNETSDFLVKLKEYDIDSKSPLSSLKDLIETRLRDGGDDFKILFVLYCLSSFMTPISNRLIDFSTVKSFVDVDKISKYDWCTYILKKLCKAVQKYNCNPLMKNVSGCVLLLQIVYFHHLKWHDIAEPCTLPLIQHWTTERFRTRIREESAAGDYGQGEWVVGTYPVSSNGRTKVEEKYEDKVHQSSVEKNEVEGSYDGIHESSRFIKYKLPDGELDYSEIHKIA